MPRVDPDDFADIEVRQLYLASTLEEARRVESVLDQCGAQYVVRVEPYTRVSLLFFWPQEFQGAAFYVSADSADAVGEALRRAGLTGIVDEATADEES